MIDIDRAPHIEQLQFEADMAYLRALADIHLAAIADSPTPRADAIAASSELDAAGRLAVHTALAGGTRG